MQKSVPHLVTGATGFVGGALVLELLSQTNAQIVVLVRRSNDASAKEAVEARFIASMEHALAAYGSHVRLSEVQERCRVVEGHLDSDAAELARQIGPIGQFWHSAASLRYENRYVGEIRHTNVQGTERMLSLARRLGASHFNYISTAYVAGRSPGRIQEKLHELPDTNNHYERSKVDAEGLVAAESHMRCRILRPSIVVGHSRTHAATSFSGFYGFLRQLVQFRGMVDRTQAGLLRRTPLMVKVDRELLIDMVAVDVVARQMVEIGLSDVGGVFHLTNDRPPRVTDVIASMFGMLDLHAPLFVGQETPLDFLGSRFHQRLDFYGSYITGAKVFDRSRTDAVLGLGRQPHVLYDDARIRALARPYLDELLGARKHMPVSR